MARAFQANADMLHISTKAIPVEAAHSMSIVERYHSPLRRAVTIIRQEAPNIDEDSLLQMAVKCVNDSVGPEGIVPTLLVFGALPRVGLPNDPPTPSTLKRAIALRKATEAMSRHFAKRQVRDAFATRNGPDVSDIHATPIGHPVLVYRPEKDRWEGSFSLLAIRGEDVVVLLPPPSGPTKFRSTVVKPFLTALANSDATGDPGSTPPVNGSRVTQTSQKASPPPTTTFTARLVSTDFTASRTAEFNGLIANSVFTLVPASDADGH